MDPRLRGDDDGKFLAATTLSLLHRPFRTYSLTENALDYLRALKYPQKWLRILQQYVGVTFLSHKAWKACMKDHGLTGKKRLKEASEALIYASLIEHGLGHLTTFSDGAQQLNVLKHAQCWVHAERLLAKVHPVDERQTKAQEWCRTWLWAIYEENVSPVWSFILGLSDKQVNWLWAVRLSFITCSIHVQRIQASAETRTL